MPVWLGRAILGIIKKPPFKKKGRCRDGFHVVDGKYKDRSESKKTMTSSAIGPTTIEIDQVTKERMQLLAEPRYRSPHWMMLEAIRQYVDREEQREVFRQAGIKAWNEYQASGLHVTLEEADAYLAKLEAGENRGIPECHG